mgnify:FL=1|tara:strand:+ start:146 stop:937 length:792 start_codon:yes stop_codon:yes gene_type:complete
MYLKVLITISILIIVLLNIYYINFYKIFLIKSNIKVFLINLDYRKDRLERFKRTYNLKNFKCYLVKAVDAKKIDIKKLKNNNLIGNYGLETLKKTKRTHHHQFNTMGAIGCYLSHIKTWQEIMKSDCKYGLIFEDDIEFNNNMTEDIICNYIAKLPNDWDILLLSKNRVTMYNINNNLYKVKKFICLHSYIVNKKSLPKIIKNITPINQQIDFKLSCLASQNIINVYLFNDLNNKLFYKQYYSNTNIQTDTIKGADWNLNCSV